jgi:hypothetical protein
MDYVETWRSIVLVQSVVRMQSARSKFLSEQAINRKKCEDAAATKIQACWRAFVCYTDFSDDLADIVTIQGVARRWLAQQLFFTMQMEVVVAAAVTQIAASWRGFVARREYIITIGGTLICSYHQSSYCYYF